jgi:hypothetical protein
MCGTRESPLTLTTPERHGSAGGAVPFACAVARAQSADPGERVAEGVARLGTDTPARFFFQKLASSPAAPSLRQTSQRFCWTVAGLVLQ